MRERECGYLEGLVCENRTQPIIDYRESIMERVYVETSVDTDGDGLADLVAVYIRRPKETLSGMKVPAIYVANPYMLRCNEDWYVPHDVNQELKVYKGQDIAQSDVKFDFSQESAFQPKLRRETAGYGDASDVRLPEPPELETISDVYSYFVCRGYASVFCGGLGTKDSEGITLTGSREEVLAFRSVIDWLCGRTRAFTNPTDRIEIKADWCTGKVAMSGKSYLGTLCIGVAMTGVEGLETIIPEAAISNWYEYYRCNGLVVPALEWQGDDLDILAKYCFSRALDPEDYAGVKEEFQRLLEELLRGEDRESGNYNRFWDERNYLNQIEHMKASALIIHGINDWNVKMNQCIPLWDAMRKQGIPVKMLLHQGDHIYIYHLKDSPALDILHRWLDFHLYGLENGVMEQIANVWVQSSEEPEHWQQSAEFPPEGTEFVTFPIDEAVKTVPSSELEGKAEITIVDDLNAAGYDQEKDNQQEWLNRLVLPEGVGKSYCSSYVWDPFSVGAAGEGKENLRIAGQVEVAFRAALNKETAILSAMLVEYGEDKRLSTGQKPSGGGMRSFGCGAPEYEEMVLVREEEASSYKVISRGHLNAQNRTCIWSKCEILPGEYLEYQFSMVPVDYRLKKGSRLGIILYGSDASQTLRPATVTEITILEDSISVRIPMI